MLGTQEEGRAGLAHPYHARGRRSVREARAEQEPNRRAFLDLLARVLRKTDESAEAPAPEADAPRLIVP